jgi:hypothetical protein
MRMADPEVVYEEALKEIERNLRQFKRRYEPEHFYARQAWYAARRVLEYMGVPLDD